MNNAIPHKSLTHNSATVMALGHIAIDVCFFSFFHVFFSVDEMFALNIPLQILHHISVTNVYLHTVGKRIVQL